MGLERRARGAQGGRRRYRQVLAQDQNGNIKNRRLLSLIMISVRDTVSPLVAVVNMGLRESLQVARVVNVFTKDLDMISKLRLENMLTKSRLKRGAHDALLP